MQKSRCFPLLRHKKLRSCASFIRVFYYEVLISYLKATHKRNSAHIVRLGSYCLAAFLMRALQGALHKNTRGSGAGAGTHNLFDLFVDQVIVDAIGTQEDTVAGEDAHLIGMDSGGERTAQRLRDAAA